MKKVIGGEISRNEPQVLDLTKSLHVLDLRKPQEKKEPPKPERPKPAELPLEPAPVPEPSPLTPAAPRVKEDPSKAEGNASEQAGSGRRDVPTQQEGGASRREEVFPEASQEKEEKGKRKWTWKRIVGQIIRAAIVIAGAVVFLSLNIDLPERLIGIYFVASVVYAIDSQRTFLVALIFLVMVAVWSALGQNVPAENYAIYAFYFLVIGLVSALRELVVHKPKTESKPSS